VAWEPGLGVLLIIGVPSLLATWRLVKSQPVSWAQLTVANWVYQRILN